MRLVVAGTGMRGSGYPNAQNTIRILRDHAGWQVEDMAYWLPEGTSLWRPAGGSRASLALSMSRLMAVGLVAAIRLLGSRRVRGGWVYAPYPAVFLLWWLSWVPVSLRPRVIADAYISLWDSAFRDRAIGSPVGWLARAAKQFEARALRAAAQVFVDTTANRDWMVEEFGIRASKIHAVPLAIDDSLTHTEKPSTERLPTGALRVLYLGTLVPLHGIQVIAEAVSKLAGDPGFQFQFVGDGQQSWRLQQLVDDEPQGVSWSRGWVSASAAAALIGDADLCFGVFGGEGKASRVLPFKVYLSLAAGIPVITQRKYSLPEGVPPPPLITVEPNADELALKLRAIMCSRDEHLPNPGMIRDYYHCHLGPGALVKVWSALIALPADNDVF